MKQFIYLNNRFLPASKASIPATDEGLLYGYGLFETLRIYNGRPFALDRHLNRLAKSLRSLSIKYRLNRSKIAVAIERLARINKAWQNGYARITLTKGKNLIIMVRPYKPSPAELYHKGVKVVSAPFKRTSSGQVTQNKTVSYLENILAREYARQKGAYEAIFLDENNSILEGSMSNIFIVQRGRIYTPPAKGILNGITRQIIIELAYENGFKIKEKNISLAELKAADEVFITNSLIELMPVTRLNNLAIRKANITSSLRSAYRKLIE